MSNDGSIVSTSLKSLLTGEKSTGIQGRHAPIASPGIARKKNSKGSAKQQRFERLESTDDGYVRPENKHRTVSNKTVMKPATTKTHLKSFPFPPGMKSGYPRGMPSGL